MSEVVIFQVESLCNLKQATNLYPAQKKNIKRRRTCSVYLLREHKLIYYWINIRN